MMMKKEVRVLNSALELSEKWDCLADVYFKKKEFLNHTEIYNPCQKHYYELYINEELSAGAIVYRLSLSYFTRKIGRENPISDNYRGSSICFMLRLDRRKKIYWSTLKEIFKKEKG